MNTGYHRPMDPDTVPGNTRGPHVPMALGGSPDICLASSGYLGHRDRHRPLLQKGPQTQTWPLAAVKARISPCTPHSCVFLNDVKSPALTCSVYEALSLAFSFISPLPTPSPHLSTTHLSILVVSAAGAWLSVLGYPGPVWLGWPEWANSNYFYGYNDLTWMCANKSGILFIFKDLLLQTMCRCVGTCT